MRSEELHSWIEGFGLDAFLSSHVAGVFAHLPREVCHDLVSDPQFMLADYEPAPGYVAHIRVGLPARNRASRSVVLKRSLRRRPESFVKYVIAHELAHAHLRNGGRWPGDDPEFAADALAAAWGISATVLTRPTDFGSPKGSKPLKSARKLVALPLEV
jgi:hypothetical protein